MASDKITSPTNPQIKHIVRLRDRKQREQDHVTIVEGVREIQRALDSDVVFKSLFICRELFVESKHSDQLVKELERRAVPAVETTPEVFQKIAYGDRSEGILAICSPQSRSFKDLSPKRSGLFVVVERVEKPGNLGAILRTCDGAGVDGVIICDGKTDIYNPNVIRASLGTVFTVKVVVATNNQTLEFLKLNGVKVCATQPEAQTIYTNAPLGGPLAVVVGSEQKGLTDFWETKADLKVRIPMQGCADSLNVAASAAILLYEAIRQRSE